MQTSSRVLLVGWDAADWKIINPLIEQGMMPNTAALIERGVCGNLATLKPAFSPMLWTSIATGKRPFKHGIHGFSEVTPDGRGVRPITNLNRSTRAIWNILTQQKKRSMVVGWWPSHPTEPINGVMVSDQYYRITGPLSQPWPLMKGAVHPPALHQELADLRVHLEDLTAEDLLPFLPTGPEIDQDSDPRVKTVARMLAECSSVQSCATHLMTKEPWDFMAVYFDAIDHFCHAFMKYHPPRLDWVNEDDFRHYSKVVTTAYQYHDLMLGRLLELADDDTTVLLISDHGFHSDDLRPKAIPNEPAGPASEHRDFGIFVMAGPGIKSDTLIHGATLLDITPTILTAFGMPIGEDMDGRCLEEVWEKSPQLDFIESWDDVQGFDGSHPDDLRYESEFSQDAMDQLAALGYIDPLAENMESNVIKTGQELSYNLALSYIDGGQHGKAAEILAELYNAQPLEFRFGIQLAQCLVSLEMLSELEQLIDDIENRWLVASQEARKRLKTIREQLNIETESTDDANPETLQEKLTDGQKRTIKSLRSIACGNPKTIKFLRSTLELARGNPDLAADYLEQAGDDRTQMAGYHLQLGDALLKMQKPIEAAIRFRRALEIDADRSHAHLGLARSLIQQRFFSDAMDSITAALALDWQSPVSHFIKARCHYHLRQIDLAISEIEAALSINPNFAEAYFLLARIHRTQLGDKTAALEYRGIAKRIRQANQERLENKYLPELPPIISDDVALRLPEFSMDDHTRWIQAIGETPIDKERIRDSGGPQESITIVTGLPRSGTSMMMQMLDAGGLTVMADDLRPADQSNPKGYFELEKVKRLGHENSWMPDARGHVLKVVAPLIPALPDNLNYRVIFMDRDMDEVMESQSSMLQHLDRQQDQKKSDEIRNHLIRQASYALALCQAHGIPVLQLPHREVISNPTKAAETIQEFLQAPLDLDAMASVVDPALHRQQKNKAKTAFIL